MKRKGVLVVISGFSGVGKGTLVKNLLKKYDYALSISMTTRAPREGEADGREYFFVTRDKFEKTIEEGGLIEHAEYCGNYYGTPRSYVESQLASGKDVILEIEAQGALQIKKKFPESFLVFVMAPDVDTLVERLNGRGTETKEAISRRLSRAFEEVDLIDDYDSVIVNDDLDSCTDRLNGIIQASKYAAYRNKDLIEELRKGFISLSEEGEI